MLTSWPKKQPGLHSHHRLLAGAARMLQAWPDLGLGLKVIDRAKEPKGRQGRNKHVLKWSTTSRAWVCIKCHKPFKQRLVKHALATCHGGSHTMARHKQGGGLIGKAAQHGHKLWCCKTQCGDSAHVYVCSRCGAYAEYRVTALLKACKNSHNSTRVGRIRKGLHPIRKVAVGKPWRVIP